VHNYSFDNKDSGKSVKRKTKNRHLLRQCAIKGTFCASTAPRKPAAGAKQAVSPALCKKHAT